MKGSRILPFSGVVSSFMTSVDAFSSAILDCSEGFKLHSLFSLSKLADYTRTTVCLFFKYTFFIRNKSIRNSTGILQVIHQMHQKYF